jgi:uncharacterized protein YjbI with pentapeptide repeats
MECKYHDICGLTDEADPEAGLCILHSHRPNKDQHVFNEALTAHRKDRGEMFAMMVFPGRANFFEATFSGEVNFFGAIFSGEADFHHTTFSESASFPNTTFSEKADFSGATFSKKALFFGATFSGEANFAGVTFSEGADFAEVTFSGEARFHLARISGEVYFGYATFSEKADFSGGTTFSGEADFSEVTFSGEADFVGTPFSGEADFRRATFSGKTDFFGAPFSEKASFAGATFSGEVDFRHATFSEKTDFARATFSSGANFLSTRFTGERASFFSCRFHGRTLFAPDPDETPRPDTSLSYLFAGVQEVDFQAVEINPPEVLTIRHADFQQTRFLDTDLRKVELTGVCWPRKGARRVVYDEIAPLEGAPYPWDQLERLYRELKKSYEDRRDYARAGDFHYGEKEMQRRNPRTPYSLKFFLWLYWIVSGYGERFLRPLLCAALLLVAGAGAYLWYGLVPKAPPTYAGPGTSEFLAMPGAVSRRVPLPITQLTEWLSAFHYSVRVMTLLKPEDLVPMGFAKVVQTLQSLLGPLFLGLFALAVRQRLKH